MMPLQQSVGSRQPPAAERQTDMPFPVEPRWIDAAEVKPGTSFPASYKAAMAKPNAGPLP
jgi:hypothetical protein